LFLCKISCCVLQNDSPVLFYMRSNLTSPRRDTFLGRPERLALSTHPRWWNTFRIDLQVDSRISKILDMSLTLYPFLSNLQSVVSSPETILSIFCPSCLHAEYFPQRNFRIRHNMTSLLTLTYTVTGVISEWKKIAIRV
jgi:hypothetical protein